MWWFIRMFFLDFYLLCNHSDYWEFGHMDMGGDIHSLYKHLFTCMRLVGERLSGLLYFLLTTTFFWSLWLYFCAHRNKLIFFIYKSYKTFFFGSQRFFLCQTKHSWHIISWSDADPPFAFCCNLLFIVF